MNKRERQRLEKALGAGTVPCAVCRREHHRDAATISRGRCVNRRACVRRARVPGRLPKFVTLGYVPKSPWGYRQTKAVDVQADEYHRVMAEQREARRVDLAVV